MNGITFENTSKAGMDAISSVMQDVFFKVDFTLVTQSASHNIEQRLNDTVLQGGKRFRPILLVMFGNLLGMSFEDLTPYARAVELTHAATLAHDDIIDEAHERRNAQTLNRVASNSHAVLGGDFLLARVIAEISEYGNIDVIREMAEVLEELVSGEWLQLEARGVVNVDHHHLETVARKKTASLISWCCTTPARLVGLSDEIIELCREFGYRVGVAFQQIDDLLDFEQGTGKTFAKDIREGQVNFVACELLKQQPQLKNAMTEVLGTGGPWPWTNDELESAMATVREMAQAQIGAAMELLRTICAKVSEEGITYREDSLNGLLETLSGVVQRTQ